MDVVLPKRRGRRALMIGAACAALIAAALGIWYLMPKGLSVAKGEVRTATVKSDAFLDNIVVRANAEPLTSVLLDSVESGRVEEVFARDGAMLTKGQVMFRLSNPQRNLELLARQAERAQQISNLSNLRVAQQDSDASHMRRLSELKFALAQQQKQHARNGTLAAQGFISPVTLEGSGDQLAQQKNTISQEQSSHADASKVRRAALAQLEGAIGELNSGLALVSETVKALTVRAPTAGRLTGFRLQVGETVKTDQRIGRVDDPAQFKVSAQVDEFYLSRIAVGRSGTLSVANQRYPVKVSTIYPQVKDGRFSVEMVFEKDQPPAISPGQSFDVQITLGEPKQALLLPNGAYINDTGGAWVYVLDAKGDSATRRALQVGRRSNSQIEVLSGLASGEKVIISSYAKFGKAEMLQLSD